jgi:hypothetical protein
MFRGAAKEEATIIGCSNKEDMQKGGNWIKAD